MPKGTPKPTSSGRQRPLKVLLLLLLVVVVFGLLGFLAAPPLIRSLAQKQLTQLLGRPTSIGHIALNPYTLTIEIRDVHVREPSGSADFLSFGDLRVQASWASLLHLKPVVSSASLNRPYAHVLRTGPQRFNFTDLVEKFAKPSNATTTSKPTLFSVSNIRVTAGQIEFDDQVLHAHHSVEALDIGIPFIANLPSKTDIYVEPSLDARVDGSPLSVRGKTKPFTTDKDSEIALRLDRVDVPKLLGYLPTRIPVVLESGVLGSDLHLHFAMAADAPTIRVTGGIRLSDVRVTDRDHHPLIAAKSLQVSGISAEPLRSVVRLGEIRLDGFAAFAARERDGRLSLAAFAPHAKPQAARKAAPEPPKGAQPEPAKQEVPLDLAVAKLSLTNTHLHFDDRAVTPATALDVSGLQITLTNFSTVARTPAHFDVHAQLTGGARLESSGTFALPAKTAHAALKIEHLALPLAQPYLAAALRGELRSGLVQVETVADVDWSSATPAILVGTSRLALDNLAVAPAHGVPPLVSVGHAQVELRSFDMTKQRAEVTAVGMRALVVHAVRSAQGRINLLDLLPLAPTSAPPRDPRSRHRPSAQAPAWRYKIGSVDVSSSSLTLIDQGQVRPVNLALTNVHVGVRQVSDDFTAAWPFEVVATVNRKGQLGAQGSVRLQPVNASVTLNAKSLDIAAFEPYFGSKLNAIIASALLDTHASVTATQSKNSWNATFQGDVGVNQVRMLDRLTSDVFAGWKALGVHQLKAAYGDHGTSVQVGKIDLASFYARIYLDNKGQLNLKNFVNRPQSQNESLTRTPGTPGTGAPAAPSSTSHAPAPAATRGAATTAGSGGPALNLGFGEIDLHDGRVDYSDNFIKPNFNAKLVNIEGKVGAFGTHSTQPATLDLQARLDASGPVHISGAVNPLVQPPFLDMTATARDIELTNFSTYSTKFTGYPIVKGNLTVDVRYKLNQNQLSASNHFFIDQFTFGDHVDSPTATNLPVRLAISLLKDRKGQIDINLPVSGSLNDPQFSVGGLLWHAFLNLVEKAATAPFSLIAGAFGGDSQEDLGYVEFDPGSDKVSVTEDAKVQKVAKGLAEHPAVKLDLVGRVDPALDTAALKQLALDRLVKLEKIRDVVGKGESVDIDSITLTPDEYNKYLEDAYKHAKFDKPSNFIGLTKSLPPDDMKKLMLDHASVGEAELDGLARRRATAVQQDFGDRVGADRVFIVAPKLSAGGISDKGKTTRVDFALH